MKHLLVVVLLSMSFTAFSQELRLTLDQGLAIGRTNTGKQFMYTSGLRGAVELKLKYNWVFTTGLGFYRVQYHNNIVASTNLFSANKFAAAQLSAKKYMRLNRNGSLFLDVGFATAYLYQRTNEVTTVAGATTQKDKNLGWNFGLFGSAGYRGMISSKIGFDLGITTTTDFASVYSNKLNKLTCDRTMLTLSFYRLKY